MITLCDRIIGYIYNTREQLAKLFHTKKLTNHQVLLLFDMMIDRLCQADGNQKVLYTIKPEQQNSCFVETCFHCRNGHCECRESIDIYSDGSCSHYEQSMANNSVNPSMLDIRINTVSRIHNYLRAEVGDVIDDEKAEELKSESY